MNPRWIEKILRACARTMKRQKTKLHATLSSWIYISKLHTNWDWTYTRTIRQLKYYTSCGRIEYCVPKRKRLSPCTRSLALMIRAYDLSNVFLQTYIEKNGNNEGPMICDNCSKHSFQQTYIISHDPDYLKAILASFVFHT